MLPSLPHWRCCHCRIISPARDGCGSRFLCPHDPGMWMFVHIEVCASIFVIHHRTPHRQKPSQPGFKRQQRGTGGAVVILPLQSLWNIPRTSYIPERDGLNGNLQLVSVVVASSASKPREQVRGKWKKSSIIGMIKIKKLSDAKWMESCLMELAVYEFLVRNVSGWKLSMRLGWMRDDRGANYNDVKYD